MISGFCKYSIHKVMILNGSGTARSAVFFEFCDTLTYVALMVYPETMYFDNYGVLILLSVAIPQDFTPFQSAVVTQSL